MLLYSIFKGASSSILTTCSFPLTLVSLVVEVWNLRCVWSTYMYIIFMCHMRVHCSIFPRRYNGACGDPSVKVWMLPSRAGVPPPWLLWSTGAPSCTCCVWCRCAGECSGTDCAPVWSPALPSWLLALASAASPGKLLSSLCTHPLLLVLHWYGCHGQAVVKYTVVDIDEVNGWKGREGRNFHAEI